MSAVAFAGDWHGNGAWALAVIAECARQGVETIYQVGDFGLWPGIGGMQYLRAIQTECAETGIQIIIVPGNHDDYDRLDAMPVDDDGWLYLPEYPHLLFAPRGHTWRDENAGWNMAALGGAGSVDRDYRKPQISWWPQERITKADCDRLVSNVKARGWDQLDVLLTHDAPDGLVRAGMFSELPPHILTYCNRQRVLLREAVDEVMPSLIVHGHWHNTFDDCLEGHIYRTRVLGLSEDGTQGNLLIMQPDDFAAGWPTP